MKTMIYFIFIFSWLSLIGLLNANVYHRYDQRLENSLNFINSVQQPDNCTGLSYVVMEIGIRGGFAAQFQLAAKEWMHLFAAHNFSVPILIQGRIIGYSDNSVCDHVKHEWTCYFKPMSECEEIIRNTGRQISADKPRRFSPIPDQFAQYGYPFWWGAVQYKIFQFQSIVTEHIHAKAGLMNHGNGFPFGLPLAGLHVRHGDKRTDGFREHSMEEELNFIRQSPDCSVVNSAGDCFKLLNISTHASTVTLHRLTKKHGIVIDKAAIDKFNRTSDTHNSEIALDPRSMFPSHGALGSHHGHHSHSQLVPHHEAADQQHVIPMQLFVASDDVNVMLSAASQGYLTSPVGVSQGTTTAQDGMLKTLLSHPEIAHAATLEIISDIYFLSQCSTLIGIAASQVFRMAVALSNVTGTLSFAAALDGDQIRRVQQLSLKYDIPFPETFYLGR